MAIENEPTKATVEDVGGCLRVVVGLALCCTVFGALIGLPMILFCSNKCYVGHCPHCRAKIVGPSVKEVSAPSIWKGFACSACGRDAVLHASKFYQEESDA